LTPAWAKSALRDEDRGEGWVKVTSLHEGRYDEVPILFERST